MQEDNEGLGLLCSVLPILAYGDISREPWQELRANDCINFIQLAQRALQYMLSQADAAHAKLVRHRKSTLFWCTAHEACDRLRVCIFCSL